MDDEFLIELVRGKSELYDNMHSKYSDTTYKTNIWKEISGKLNQDAGKCKNRWESLRSQFRRHVRNQKIGDPSGSSRKWKYSENLRFLFPYMKDKIKMINVDDSEVREEEVEVSQETKDPIQKSAEELATVDQDQVVWTNHHSQGRKRKFPSQETDEYDLFFDAIKKTVKKFSPADKLLVKRQLFNIVAEIEEKYVVEQQGIIETYTQFEQQGLPSQNSQEYKFSPQSSKLKTSPTWYEDTTNQSTLSTESRPSSAGSVHSVISNFTPDV